MSKHVTASKCLSLVQMYVACGGAAAAVAATSYSPSHALTHVLAAAASAGPAAALREAGAVTTAARMLCQHDRSRVGSGALSAAALRKAGAVAAAARVLCQHDGSRAGSGALPAPACSQPLSGAAAAGAPAGRHGAGAGLEAARDFGAGLLVDLGFVVDEGAAQAACLALAALCAGSPGARAELCREGVRLPAACRA